MPKNARPKPAPMPAIRGRASQPQKWRDRPERAALMALYAEADALVAGWTCDESTDCCRFGVTGREPYVTGIELAEVKDALKARGGKGPTRKSLPVAGEKRCPMLTDEGRCVVYESRPLGCRTFFCAGALAKLGEKLPRTDFQRIVRAIEELSEKTFPDQAESRPLTRVLG